METVVAPSIDEDLNLLLQWQRLDDPARTRKAAIYSVIVHALFIGTISTIPHNAPARPPTIVRLRRITPLFDPPSELTQKAPNKGKITKEITADMIPERPRIQAPAPAPATRRSMPPPALPPTPVAKSLPQPAIPEPPKATPQPTQTAQLPAPQIQPPPEKPKLAFETPGGSPPAATPSGVARLAIPNPSIQEAVRNMAHGGSSGGLTVGDSISDGSAAPPGMQLPPSAGRPRAQLELLSDPMGVDLKPYILQVLQTVRRNWFAVYPESAKLGQRGMVNITFSIEPSGTLAKLVISSPSGVRALDQAAVAALSASNPLAPLPSEFHGNRIILRFTFSYNIPVR